MCVGDTEVVKFLSYHYEAHTDTFYVKPVINWSPRHRGARKAPDITTHADLVEYIASNPVTKRHVASMVMGTMFDSLQIFYPYRTNLKLIYRDVCRMSLEWDTFVGEEITKKIIESLVLIMSIFQFRGKFFLLKLCI